jgi:hypothetical protein
VGRTRFVVFLLVVAAVAAVAVVAVSRAARSGTHPKPAPAASNGLADDANVMRLLQRGKFAKAGK